MYAEASGTYLVPFIKASTGFCGHRPLDSLGRLFQHRLTLFQSHYRLGYCETRNYSTVLYNLSTGLMLVVASRHVQPPRRRHPLDESCTMRGAVRPACCAFLKGIAVCNQICIVGTSPAVTKPHSVGRSHTIITSSYTARSFATSIK